MKHLFKVQLQHADMFISNIDLVNSTIVYQIRNKDTGLPMEPERTDKMVIYKDNYMFSSEAGRSISIKLGQHINHILL